MKKHYHIREYSPLWWVAQVSYGAFVIAGCYAMVLLATSFPY